MIIKIIYRSGSLSSYGLILSFATAALLAAYLGSLLNRDLDRAMAPLSINSKLRMNSGHEIPVLGYGVSDEACRKKKENNSLC